MVRRDLAFAIESAGVAGTHRVDERLFLGAGVRARESACLLNGRIGARLVLWRAAFADIRSPHPRLAPVTDRAVWIAFLRFAKRSTRFGACERIRQLEALIEVRLRLGAFRGDRPGERTEADF